MAASHLPITFFTSTVGSPHVTGTDCPFFAAGPCPAVNPVIVCNQR